MQVGVIYIVLGSRISFVSIGYSSTVSNLYSRYKYDYTDSITAYVWDILYEGNKWRQIESDIHDLFSDHKINYELFELYDGRGLSLIKVYRQKITDFLMQSETNGFVYQWGANLRKLPHADDRLRLNNLGSPIARVGCEVLLHSFEGFNMEPIACYRDLSVRSCMEALDLFLWEKRKAEEQEQEFHNLENHAEQEGLDDQDMAQDMAGVQKSGGRSTIYNTPKSRRSDAATTLPTFSAANSMAPSSRMSSDSSRARTRVIDITTSCVAGSPGGPAFSGGSNPAGGGNPGHRIPVAGSHRSPCSPVTRPGTGHGPGTDSNDKVRRIVSTCHICISRVMIKLHIIIYLFIMILQRKRRNVINDDEEDNDCITGPTLGSSAVSTAPVLGSSVVSLALTTVVKPKLLLSADAVITVPSVSNNFRLATIDDVIVNMGDPNVSIRYPLIGKKQDEQLRALGYYGKGIDNKFDKEVLKAKKNAPGIHFLYVLDLENYMDIKVLGASRASLWYRLFTERRKESECDYEYKLLIDDIDCNDSLVVVKATAAATAGTPYSIEFLHFKVRTYRVAVMMLFALNRLFASNISPRHLALKKPNMTSALEWDKIEFWIVQNLEFRYIKCLAQALHTIPNCISEFDRTHVQMSVKQNCVDDACSHVDECDRKEYTMYLKIAKELMAKNRKDENQEQQRFKNRNVASFQDGSYEDSYDARNEYTDVDKLEFEEALNKIENDECVIEPNDSSDESALSGCEGDDDISCTSSDDESWYIKDLEYIIKKNHVPEAGDREFISLALSVIDYFKNRQFFLVSNESINLKRC